MSRSTFIAASLLLIIASLVSCGEDPEALREDYEQRVIAVLEGDPENDTGVGQMLSITIGDLGCEGDICTAPLRFQFLQSEPRVRMARVADYRAQICKPEFEVPDFISEKHNVLCDDLQDFVRHLDAITVIAANGANLAPSGSAVNALLEEISNRLAAEKSALLETQERLREIEFLSVVMSR